MTASWMRHLTGLAHVVTATGSDSAATACGVSLPKPLDRVPLDKHGQPSGGYNCPQCLQIVKDEQ